MPDVPKKVLKRSGRAQRIAQRAAKPVIDPCPAGQIGGAYRPLSDADLKRIYDTALRLLSDLGMGEVPDRLRSDLLNAGAQDNGAGRILFPRSLVENAIAKAAKKFVLHGRDENRSIEVGGNKVYFGTGGAAVQTGPQRWLIFMILPAFRTPWRMSVGSHVVAWPRMCQITLIWM